MRHAFKKLPGFTLVELMIYIGVASIILSGLVIFIWTIIGVATKVSVTSALDAEARYAQERLTQEIAYAAAVNTSTSQFGTDLAVSTTAQLSLQTSPPNNPTLITVSGGALIIKQGTSTPVALTSSAVIVKSLVFTNASDSGGLSKHVGFVFSMVSATGTRQEFSASSTVRSGAELRN